MHTTLPTSTPAIVEAGLGAPALPRPWSPRRTWTKSLRPHHHLGQQVVSLSHIVDEATEAQKG